MNLNRLDVAFAKRQQIQLFFQKEHKTDSSAK